MAQTTARPEAVIVWVVAGRALPIGTVRAAPSCDLQVVDDLARLFLAASRLGWTIRLADVHPRLRELCRLAGLEECFGL